MRLVLALPFVLAACGDDPSLRVSVAHPDGASVETTTITVYESESARCTDVEFGILGDEELTALEVAALTLDAEGAAIAGGLTGLSRTGGKLVVARGFDAAGTLVTAGCVEHQEIVEDDEARVVTVEVATISLGAGGMDLFGVDVTVTNAAGTAIADRAVGWRAFGPAGTEPAVMDNVALVATDPDAWEPAQPACTNSDGRLRLRPVPPDRAGGFAFDIRASWAASPPRLFSSFTRVAFDLEPFTPPDPAVPRWCAIRATSSERNLVCLERIDATTVQAVKHVITVTNGTAVFAANPQRQAVPPGTVGVVSVDRGGGIVDVYAVTAKAQIVSVFSPSVTIDVPPSLPLADSVLDLAVGQACGAGDTPKLVLITGTNLDRKVEIMDALMGPRLVFPGVPDDAALSINNVGCLTELDPDPAGASTIRQVVVLDAGRGAGASTSAHFACSAAGGRCAVRLPVTRAGVGFTGGAEPRMVGAFFDASGVVLSAWVALPDASLQPRLVERERLEAASFPQKIASGLVDDDTGLDLVWAIANGTQQTTNLQIAYERQVAGARLTALSGAQDVVATELLTGDVTGDGRADVIVLGAVDGTTGAAVIPAHVPVSPGTFEADVPCAP